MHAVRRLSAEVTHIRGGVTLSVTLSKGEGGGVMMSPQATRNPTELWELMQTRCLLSRRSLIIHLDGGQRK